MYRIRAIVEADCETEQQAQTVQRRFRAAMREAFQGAPYQIRGAVSPPVRVEPAPQEPAPVAAPVVEPAKESGHA